jgi:hypothetical protein
MFLSLAVSLLNIGCVVQVIVARSAPAAADRLSSLVRNSAARLAVLRRRRYCACPNHQRRLLPAIPGNVGQALAADVRFWLAYCSTSSWLLVIFGSSRASRTSRT